MDQLSAFESGGKPALLPPVVAKCPPPILWMANLSFAGRTAARSLRHTVVWRDVRSHWHCHW